MYWVHGQLIHRCTEYTDNWFTKSCKKSNFNFNATLSQIHNSLTIYINKIKYRDSWSRTCNYWSFKGIQQICRVICCKLLQPPTQKEGITNWGNILKSILYLSIRQHILIEGSIPENYKHFPTKDHVQSKEIIQNNAQVRNLINYRFKWFLIL